MTIYYCDYINGDDSTGDGSAGNPYKTITQASTGLIGGDEVRVAKSPADTALTGTLGFTNGSTAVTGASTLFTSELAIGDFVKGGDGQYYEVVTITDNTNAILFKVYPGSTETGVSSYKLGITSTGAAAAAGTNIQTVSASGSSITSRLKISGGWDLTGPTQDGQTFFRQMHGTFANRYGRGLYASGKDYIEIDHLHFLRYDNCLHMYACDGWKVTSANLLSAGDEACYLIISANHEFISPVINSSADRAFYLNFCNNIIITTPICNGHTYAIYMSDCVNNVVISPTCNNNTYGIYLSRCGVINIINPTHNDNTYGIYTVYSSNITVNTFSGTGNLTEDIAVSSGRDYGEYPCVSCQHFKTAGANKCFYEYGVTERDTTDARSTQCLKFDPTSAIYYILQSFFFKADSGVGQTLSAYIKDDSSFNGDIQAAIYFMGEKITGWTAWTPTTSYVQQTIVAAAGDVTEDGVLELRIKVRGTAGNVFVDDLGTA